MDDENDAAEESEAKAANATFIESLVVESGGVFNVFCSGCCSTQQLLSNKF